ncbi:unnamed protein product [Closterium sp. NIES-53]
MAIGDVGLPSDRLSSPPSLAFSPVRCVAVTLQSSPPQPLVPVVLQGARGAAAEGEGTGAAGAGGANSGGAKGVGVEATLWRRRRPRPASPLGFPSVPQFLPRSSMRLVATEPGGDPAGGTGGTGGVVGGVSSSGGSGAGGAGTSAPTLCGDNSINGS